MSAKHVITIMVLMICLSGFAGLSIGATEPGADENIKTWRWENMKPDDLRKALETVPVAWVVFSPLEWHGEAMAFGCDPSIGQAVVDNAWQKVGGVRIPTILIGAETDYKYWGEKGLMSHWGLEQITEQHNPGSLYVRPITLKLVVEDYLYFLERNGFKLVVVSTGHGATEHIKVIKEVEKAYENGPMKVVFSSGWGAKLPEELRFKGSGGHADFSEASLLGGVDPNMVDISKFGVTERDQKIKLFKENAEKIDFEKGRKIIELRAEHLANEVRSVLEEMNKES